jgi:hypothetical protein
MVAEEFRFEEGVEELVAEEFGEFRQAVIGQADVVGDPTSGLEDTALMAGGTEVAGLAGEGEQVLMAAAGAGEAGEAGGKIAATTEGLNGGDGFGPERAHGRAVLFLVTGNKIIPATVDNLPEGRRPRAPRMVNGGRGGQALICSKILILQIEW